MSARTSTENKPSIQAKMPLTGAERPKCQTEENYFTSSDPHHDLAFLSGILIWHSSLAFYLALYLTFYLAFYLAYVLALRSGREHLAWILAVEVRRGTLGVDSRG